MSASWAVLVSFFDANDMIDALDDKLIILLRRISSRISRLAHKGFRGRHQIYVEIDVWKNKAILVKPST